MRKYGLIGYPLSHSFSQAYFSEKFKKEGIVECQYLNFPLRDITELPQILSAGEGLSGLNVTIPYKQKVLAYVDFPDKVVLETGACNCIRILQGRTYGYNTDVMGFETALKKKLQPWHSRALVLGTGGASRAVVYVLQKLAIPFLMVSRKPTGDKQIGYDQLSEALVESHTLIVNSTPLGMYPEVDSCPDIPYQMLGASHYLFDLVYNPAKTIFLQRGESRGAAIENGLSMLELQAEESWRIWNS